MGRREEKERGITISTAHVEYETEKKQNNDCYYMDSAMRMDDVHEFMRKSAL